jgi:histidine ammonia-lyase
VGLAADEAADGGVVSLNLNYIGSARMGSLLAAAAPVILHYVGNMSDGVEDVTSLLPLSVTQTRAVIDRAWEAAAIEMAIAVWAMARRRLEPAALGAGPRRVYELLLPLLPIGEEGTRIFNMRHIVAAVRAGDFVEHCLSMASGE